MVTVVIKTGECTKLSQKILFYCAKKAQKRLVILKFYSSLLGNEPVSDNTEVCKHHLSTIE